MGFLIFDTAKNYLGWYPNALKKSDLQKLFGRTDLITVKGNLPIVRKPKTRIVLDQDNKVVVDNRPNEDVSGFIEELKTIMQDNWRTMNALLVKYPLFLDSLFAENWPYVEGMLKDAGANGDLTSVQMTAIQSGVVKHHIPITLT